MIKVLVIVNGGVQECQCQARRRSSLSIGAMYRYYEMTNNLNGSPEVGEEKEVSRHRGYNFKQSQSQSQSQPQPQLPFLPQQLNSSLCPHIRIKK
jgi:hypothetical protein